MLEFEILGPLVVRGDGGEIRVAGQRRRALLVRFLVAANDLVPAPRLAEDLWDGEPPAGAASTLQSHISLLRQALGPGRLVGRDGGYVLDVADDELDVRRFETESRQGRHALAAGDPATASVLLGTALGRWHGAALADVSGADWAMAERTRLEELRSGAIETWLEARLELGEHLEVVALAEAAVAEHALREEIWGHLMLALYRSGRQSDALRAYQRLRTLLGEELGIEPSAQLVALDDAIVQQKPELEWSGAAPIEQRRGSKTTAPSTAGAARPQLPSGTVSLLFTDIVGSTRFWEDHPDEMAVALARHDTLLRAAVHDGGGYVFKTVGDAICAAFATAHEALAAAVAAQRALGAEEWPEHTSLHVRMGLHTGVCEERDGDYFGPTVNRTARLAAAAQGDQIVVSGASAGLLGASLPDGMSLLDLGEHELKDLTRPERVFQVVAPGLVRDFDPLRSLDASARGHNLPRFVSSFVGREEQLKEIPDLIRANRLVTLSGTGGVGKTRLALEVATELLDETADGVWVVELAPLPDSESVSRALAKLFAVREHSDRPAVEGVVRALGDRNILLVLDNCEHILDPVARIAQQILEYCPEVTILTTSREALGIAGETVVRVDPMRTPPPQVTACEDVMEFEAVRLFVERAASHQPTFTLDGANCGAVASICRRLDGVPLALELAATRLRSLSVTDVEQRLDQRFRFLTGGSRAVLPRQRTLRAVVDWSYELLSDSDGAVLCRLSVFAGSWELSAATAVCGADDLDAWAVEDAVGSLVDKSLVQADCVGDVVRYRLLETIRSYAEDALGAREGEDAAARRAHAAYYQQVAEAAGPHLTGPEQGHWLRALELDHDNLRAAMAELLSDTFSTELALRFGISMRWFWFTRGYYSEGIEFLEAVLERPDTAELPELKAAALATLGTLHQPRGEDAAARARLEDALAISTLVGSSDTAADTLCELAWLAFRQGEEDRTVELATGAIDLARTTDNANLIGLALSIRGGVVFARDRPRGRADIDEAIVCFQKTGDRKRLSGALCRLAMHELEVGELDAARVHLIAVREIAVELEDEGILPFVHFGLGFCALLGSHDLRRAREFFQDALTAARRVDDPGSVAYAALGLAFCATASGDAQAPVLHGAADALLESQGGTWEEPEIGLRHRDHQRLHDELGAAAFNYGYSTGRHLPAPAAVGVALDYARREDLRARGLDDPVGARGGRVGRWLTRSAPESCP